MDRCTLSRDPLPLGWGDHVRWMHEQDDWRRSAGARHADARRGANAIREWAARLDRIAAAYPAAAAEARQAGRK